MLRSVRRFRENARVEVVGDPEPGVAKRVEFRLDIDGSGVGSAEQNSDHARDCQIVSSSHAPAVRFVDEHEVRVVLDRVADRGRFAAVQFAKHLGEQRRLFDRHDGEKLSVAQLAKRIGPFGSVDELVPDLARNGDAGEL